MTAMKLSTRSEYGTRALVELALHHGDSEPLMLQTIADRQHISKKYLEQLFILLRKGGIVEGVRGPTGGYRLTRPPSEIRMDEVIASLEGGLAVAECLVEEELCAHNGNCATQEIWARMTSAIEGVLGSVTLDELTERHRCLLDRMRTIPGLAERPLACGQFSSKKSAL